MSNKMEEAMNEKLYEIANVKFKLRPELDYDIDESEELSKLQRILFSPSKNIIAGEFTGNDMERFLQLVLVTADGKPLPEGFSFRRAKEKVQLEVWSFFLLSRIKSGVNIAADLAGLIGQLPEQSKS